MSKDFSGWYSVPSSGKVQCKACDLVFANRKCRMLSHLGYEGKDGVRDKGISICPKLTSSIRTLFVGCNGLFPRRSALDNVDGENTGRVASNTSNGRDLSRSTQEDSCTAPSESHRASSRVHQNVETSSEQCPTPPSSITRPRRQSRLVDGFEQADRCNLNALWANFFYSANVPFAVARSEAFREAVKKTAEFGKPYSPPSYNALRTKLLEEAKEDVKVKLQKRTEDSIRKFGATLSIDGWSSVTNRPLVNCMLVSSAGEQFLGSVDTSGSEKNAEYLASILDKFIQEVGPHNVVQITTDNAPVNPRACRIITNKYPHISFQGCVVHALNLLLKDWGKEAWLADVVAKARTVLTFFRKRHMPLAIFRDYEKEYSLLMPGETRFASNFIALERLLKVKGALQQSVTDPRWEQYVRTLDDKKSKNRTKSRKTKRIINSEHFWRRCTNFVELMGAVVYGLRDLDAKTPCSGKVLHIMRKIRSHVEGLENPPFLLSPELAKPLKNAFQARWEMVETDLQYAGALLNPYLLHDKELADDSEAIEACKRVLMRICNPTDYADVVKEFMAFRLREPPFHNMLDPSEQKLSAHAWWDFEGACGKLIAPIARRILGQPVSSSSCERNWSSYSFVHNKSRNKLRTKRAADLVYVYTNSRVLAASKERDEKKWYLQNVDSEESEGPNEDDESSEDEEQVVRVDRNEAHGQEAGWNDPMFDEEEDLDGNTFNFGGEPFGRVHMDDDDMGNNDRDEYDFPMDDEDCRNDEGIPSIARFVDGNRFLSSDKVLNLNEEDANVRVPASNGIIASNSGTSEIDEVIGGRRSPSIVVAQLEKNDNVEDREEMNVDKISVESLGGLARKSNGEPSNLNHEASVTQDNAHSRLIECVSPNLLHNGQGTKENMASFVRPPRSIPAIGARSLFNSVSTTLVDSRSSQCPTRVSIISKEIEHIENQRLKISSFTDDEEDETLASMLKKQGSRLPPSLTRLADPTLESSNAIEAFAEEGRKAGMTTMDEPSKAKKKRVMEPFAISPTKKVNAGKAPFDKRPPIPVLPLRKRKAVDCLRERVGKTLMKAKKEQMMGKPKRTRVSSTVQEERGGNQTLSSDDEDNTMSDEDDGFQSREYSSGAEVKGDSDYHP